MKSLKFPSFICQHCLKRKVIGFSQFPALRSIMTWSRPVLQIQNQLSERPVVRYKKPRRPTQRDPQLQGERSIRPDVDPEETTVLLFPGQCSQYVGMGKQLLHLPKVAELYATAGMLLGYDLEEVSLNGPEDRLNKNEVCGPAILVASLGAVEKLRSQLPEAISSCYSTAGFGLGEITALVFAGALTFEEGVMLAKERGRCLQMASESVPSGMLLVHTTHKSKLKYACKVAQEIARRNGEYNALCSISVHLHPDLVMVSGLETCLQFIISQSSEFHLEKVERLPLSGGFHSKLMSPVIEEFVESLKKCDVRDPDIPVHSNMTGKPYVTSKEVYKNLPMNLVSQVKLQTMFHVMYERSQGQSFPATYHCGPGDYLLQMLQKVNAKAFTHAQAITV